MTIALTIGDCNGIGPECGLKALQHLCSTEKELLRNHNVNFAIISGRDTLRYWVELHNSFEKNDLFLMSDSELKCSEETIAIVALNADTRPSPGTCDTASGLQAKEALERSVEGLKSGEFDGVVTLPVNKYALRSVGFEYPGQTEFYTFHDAHDEGIMMLMGEDLRVALATVHVALQEVPALITETLIQECLESLYATLRQDFACSRPRIAVLGLNPHAGEKGLMGTEENTIERGMQAAMAAISERGGFAEIEGPFPADGFFARRAWHSFDAVLAMYHDQGLIPVKMVAGTSGVNYTTGLNIVRTSPDHGTAETIAGKHIADASSTIAAITMAMNIGNNRKAFLHG